MDCLALLRTALCLLLVVAFVAGDDDLPPDQGNPPKDEKTPNPDDFRPTTPGHSPGVGYDETDTQPDATQPTNPGHSPGIGHGHNPHDATDDCPNANPEQGPEIVPVNPPPTDDTTEPEPDTFKPTTPGHSPGIGHPLRRRF